MGLYSDTMCSKTDVQVSMDINCGAANMMDMDCGAANTMIIAKFPRLRKQVKRMIGCLLKLSQSQSQGQVVKISQSII